MIEFVTKSMVCGGFCHQAFALWADGRQRFRELLGKRWRLSCLLEENTYIYSMSDIEVSEIFYDVT